ncbi:MAG: Bll5482 protein [uncultured Microvirga sp.]|uniref:Bll5482 protein n=1 Tax=uncultured Microvirga sp. TaxID=412392 RepID=A0A6J4L8E7_9HYPH|nr:MAG: Bll5482 protein [uncultured Microvirga sp.]
MSREFWVSSGHHLTHRVEGGGLAITDELLLAYLARPELMPPDDACAPERALHAALLAEPRRPVTPGEVQAIADSDARENWAFMLRFRDRLVAARTAEAAYLALLRDAGDVPPLFLNQIVHLILRNALDGCEDPYVLRAGELFFRPQRASFHDGAVLLADAEIIEAHEGAAPKSPLVAMLGKEVSAELDVLDDGNAWTYWSRSDAFSMALNMSANPRSREGLARVIEVWLAHLMHIEARVEPVVRIEDRDWRWFIGLDADATRIGNQLWRGEPVEDQDQGLMLALFRLTFARAERLDPAVAGHPAYLLFAMGRDKSVRLKPQNLIAGLPLADGARAA